MKNKEYRRNRSSGNHNKNSVGQKREPHFPSFSEIIYKEAKRADTGTLLKNIEPLAHLDYTKELALKNQALARFWEIHGLPGKPDPIIASPRPRHYRTTTKRRVLYKKGKVLLSFSDDCDNTTVTYDSMLEPLQHASIYRTVQETLNTPLYLRCGRSLNYVIVRGTYSEQIVIFNAFSLNGEIVRRLRMLAEKVRSSYAMVIAAFIYFDPSRSSYYLESEKPSNTFRMKKLSGYHSFRLVIDDRKYQVPPASFSQVNQSLLPVLAKTIRDELTPGKNRMLLDVYCGYGFFSHYLSNDYREITGIDAASGSIEAAKANARYNPHGARLTFKTFMISGDNPGRILPPAPAAGYEDVILDPPKSGSDNKTIEYIASRNPRKVIHIFCGIDEIPRSLKTWEACGYGVEKIIPLDMFAGTENVETVVVLGPGKSK